MWVHIPFEQSFKSRLLDGLIGEYRVSDSLAIHLDVDFLKANGMYSEIYYHEYTHLQLTTSTAFGHATQFLAAMAQTEIQYFKNLYKSLLGLSFEAQEGAATLVQWQWREREGENIDKSIESFQNELPDAYRTPFDIFNTTAQVLLAPEMYFLKDLFANALGQFFLNTDILQTLILGFKGKSGLDIKDYFDRPHNHPQLRRRTLIKSFGAANSKEREEKCGEIAGRLKTTADELSKRFPDIVINNELLPQNATNKDLIQINDSLNQTFLVYFSDICGLPLPVNHSRDARALYNELLDVVEKQSGLPLTGLRGPDMSASLDLRDQFHPRVGVAKKDEKAL